MTSAEYGESCEVWNADHLNLVNWPNRRAKGAGVCGKTGQVTTFDSLYKPLRFAIKSQFFGAQIDLQTITS